MDEVQLSSCQLLNQTIRTAGKRSLQDLLLRETDIAHVFGKHTAQQLRRSMKLSDATNIQGVSYMRATEFLMIVRDSTRMSRTRFPHNDEYPVSFWEDWLSTIVVDFRPTRQPTSNTYKQFGVPVDNILTIDSDCVYIFDKGIADDHHDIKDAGLPLSNRVIKIGMSNDLTRRNCEHRSEQRKRGAPLTLLAVGFLSRNGAKSVEAGMICELRKRFVSVPIADAHGHGSQETFSVPTNMVSDVLNMFRTMFDSNIKSDRDQRKDISDLETALALHKQSIASVEALASGTPLLLQHYTTQLSDTKEENKRLVNLNSERQQEIDGIKAYNLRMTSQISNYQQEATELKAEIQRLLHTSVENPSTSPSGESDLGKVKVVRTAAPAITAELSRDMALVGTGASIDDIVERHGLSRRRVRYVRKVMSAHKLDTPWRNNKPWARGVTKQE